MPCCVDAIHRDRLDTAAARSHAFGFEKPKRLTDHRIAQDPTNPLRWGGGVSSDVRHRAENAPMQFGVETVHDADDDDEYGHAEP